MFRKARDRAALAAAGVVLALAGACGSSTGGPGGEGGAVDAGSPSAAGADVTAGATSGGVRGGSAGATSSSGGRTSDAGAGGTGETSEVGGEASRAAGAAGDGGAPPTAGCLLGYPGPSLTRIHNMPRVVVAGDMNADGRTDLIVGNWINLGNRQIASLSVLLGRGEGTFSMPIDYDLGSFAPTSIALADFNGDRQLDVAVTGGNGQADSPGLLVFRGAGGGTLAQPIAHAVGDSPSAVVAADLDADGHTDLAVANHFSADVTVLLNTGDGTIGPGRAIRSGLLAIGLVAADFDGDGWTDLAVAEAGSFNVLVNLGHGVFVDDVSSIGTGAGAEPAVSLVAADFNHDGRPDLALGCEGDVLAVYQNAGALTFGVAARYKGGGSILSASDLDADGFDDLVSTDGVQLRSRRNLGDGTFGALVTITQVGLALTAAGDFDGDARLDLAAFSVRDIAAVPPEGAVGVLLNQGSGTIGAALHLPARPIDILAPPGNTVVAVGDLNDDQVDDLISVDTGDHSLDVQLGGRDFASSRVARYSPGAAPFAAQLADFNGDQKLDVLVADAAQRALQIMFNEGAGTLGEPRVYAQSSLLPPAVGDFDGDSTLDIAALSFDGELELLMNHGDGTFADAIPGPSGPLPTAMIADDFDGDGKADLALAGSGALRILFSKGDGSFRPPVDYSDFAGAYSIVSADFDANGDSDLAILGFESLRLLTNSGGGSFAVSHDYPVTDSGAIVAADVNADKLPDLVVALRSEGAVSLFINDGLGGFAPPLDYFAGPSWTSSAGSLAVGDLNGDRSPDLAIGSRAGAGLDLLFGRCLRRR